MKTIPSTEARRRWAAILAEVETGQEYEITHRGVVVAVLRPPFTRSEMVERLRKFRGMMPADFKFDRDDANAR